MRGQEIKKSLYLHPSAFFAYVWGFTAFLTALRWTPRLTQDANGAIKLAILIVVFNVLGAGLASISPTVNRSEGKTETSELNFRFRTGLIALWVFVSAGEVYFSEGIPLQWVLFGSDKTYEEFGLPSIHGFTNAIYLYITIGLFMQYFHNKNMRIGALFLLFFSWTILVYSRALMTIIVLTCVIYLLINSKLYMRKYATYAILFIPLFIFGFGYIGNSRSERFSILYALDLDIDIKYSGLAWIYAYIVSPLANLNLNVQLETTDLHFFPSNFLLPMVPSFVQRALGYEVGFFGFSGYLVHDAFNVSTGFMQIYMDWGVTGILLFSLLLGFVGHLTWRAYQRSGRSDVMSLFIACCLLSIFSNQFNQLPIIVLAILMQTVTQRKNEINLYSTAMGIA